MEIMQLTKEIGKCEMCNNKATILFMKQRFWKTEWMLLCKSCYTEMKKWK